MAFDFKIDCHSKTSFYLNRDRIHDSFFADVRKYPLLSEEEESKLFQQYKHGKTEQEREKAKNRLIECNLRFVISIAKKLGNSETFLDLVNEGNIGLIKAIEKYDKSKNCRLITYALSWIVVSIQKYQFSQVNCVAPPNALKLHNYVNSVTKEFYKENERNPTSYETAEIIKEKFNFQISNLEDVELGHVISIEEKINGTEDSIEESNTYLSRTSSNNIQKDIEEEYQKHKLDFFLGKLTERERFVVEHFYGIGCEQESLDTIGYQLNIGGERIRQICTTAIKKMQKYKKMVNI